jgi:hypothetical protein
MSSWPRAIYIPVIPFLGIVIHVALGRIDRSGPYISVSYIRSRIGNKKSNDVVLLVRRLKFNIKRPSRRLNVLSALIPYARR